MSRRFIILFILIPVISFSQTSLSWKNVDSAYGPLPPSVHVYFAEQVLDSFPFRAFYVIADLKDKDLEFTTDTSKGRRLTPSQFHEKTGRPLVVVNTTFFSFETNQNLNLVIKNGVLLAHNRQHYPGRGKDTLTYRHTFPGAIGVTKKRNADVVWTVTDSTTNAAYFMQTPDLIRDSLANPLLEYLDKSRIKVKITNEYGSKDFPALKKWNVQTAVGGGPVLIQDGQIAITNDMELKFPGKAILDKHPRTAMGYTAKNKFIILVIEGRNPNAAGATLIQEAKILKELGCIEALNLDGGGSSCLLVNGKETIKPSDNKQRAVPAVFIIQSK